MATFPNAAIVLLLHLLLHPKLTAAIWCVARNDAAEDALQTALDYACGAGADCAPVQESGPCFLPNTVQAHASYAFNSFYMHSSMDPAACDFAGTATVAKTDPSYGSCVYPASPRVKEGQVDVGRSRAKTAIDFAHVSQSCESTAGGIKNPPLDTTLPPPQNGAPLGGNGGALTPLSPDMTGATPNGSGGAFITPIGMAPALDNSPSSEAFLGFSSSRFLFMGMMFMVFFSMS